MKYFKNDGSYLDKNRVKLIYNINEEKMITTIKSRIETRVDKNSARKDVYESIRKIFRNPDTTISGLGVEFSNFIQGMREFNSNAFTSLIIYFYITEEIEDWEKSYYFAFDNCMTNFSDDQVKSVGKKLLLAWKRFYHGKADALKNAMSMVPPSGDLISDWVEYFKNCDNSFNYELDEEEKKEDERRKKGEISVETAKLVFLPPADGKKHGENIAIPIEENSDKGKKIVKVLKVKKDNRYFGFLSSSFDYFYEAVYTEDIRSIIDKIKDFFKKIKGKITGFDRGFLLHVVFFFVVLYTILNGYYKISFVGVIYLFFKTGAGSYIFGEKKAKKIEKNLMSSLESSPKDKNIVDSFFEKVKNMFSTKTSEKTVFVDYFMEGGVVDTTPDEDAAGLNF